MKNRFFKVGILGCMVLATAGVQADVVTYNNKNYDLDATQMREYRACFYDRNRAEALANFFKGIKPLKPKVAPKPTRSALRSPSPSSSSHASSSSPDATPRLVSPRDVDQTCASGQHSVDTACGCGPVATPAPRSLGDFLKQDERSAQRMALQMQQRKGTVDPELQAEMDALSLELARSLQFEEDSRASRPTSPAVRAPMEVRIIKGDMADDQRTSSEVARDLENAMAMELALQAVEDAEAQEATMRMLAQEARVARMMRLMEAYNTAQFMRESAEQDAIIAAVAGDFEEAEREALTAAFMQGLEQEAAREFFEAYLQ